MSSVVAQPQPVHFLPIATTCLSVVFLGVLIRRYRFKGKGAHLLWWAAGVFAYGLGTALEGTITLLGNSASLTKAWYIAGALLGGYPLAQGTVYLLLRRRTANILTAATLPLIAGAALLVLASPVRVDAIELYRPSGKVLAWWQVRLFTPVINGYAASFLIGGAALSAWRFARHRETANRALGNVFIAAGALAPAVGGVMAKAGRVEGLYVTEIVGLLLIWGGYAACVRRPVVLAAVPRPRGITPAAPVPETIASGRPQGEGLGPADPRAYPPWPPPAPQRGLSRNE